MPGTAHEAVVQILHEHPELVGVLVGRAGVRVPAGTVTVVDSDLSARRPLALSSDQVTVIGEGSDRLAVVGEVQTWPPDIIKWRVMDAYRAIAAHEFGCPAVVLVVALREETARACRRLFFSGPGSQMMVAVIGPGDLADPIPGLGTAQWAALAAATGALDLGRRDDQVRALDAVTAGPENDRPRYTQLILALAPDQALAGLEALVATAYKENLVDRLLAQGKAEGKAEGEATGRAQAVLEVLAARGVTVPDEVRDKEILACTRLDDLDGMLRRAATATTISDVIDDPPKPS